MEKRIMEITKRREDGGKDNIKSTVEQWKKWGLFGRQILRLYWNGTLIIETNDDSIMSMVEESLHAALGITERDLGILPADPKEWTREDMMSLIDCLEWL